MMAAPQKQSTTTAPDGACLIPLSKGKCALVDAVDYGRVRQYKWCFNGQYAVRNLPRSGQGRGGMQLLHLFLQPRPEGFEVDHINGNKLDCRRANLRIATRTQNMRNRARQRNNTSGYKGVYWNKKERQWRAHIKVDGILHYLGKFASAEEGALAYNAAARALFGDFAWLNEVSHGTA